MSTRTNGNKRNNERPFDRDLTEEMEWELLLIELLAIILGMKQ